MSRTNGPPFYCDADQCPATAVYRCECNRCKREPDARERFHACGAHLEEVGERHNQVRGYRATFVSVPR